MYHIDFLFVYGLRPAACLPGLPGLLGLPGLPACLPACLPLLPALRLVNVPRVAPRAPLRGGLQLGIVVVREAVPP